MWRGYKQREKEELWRIAWINAEQYNTSGLLEKNKHVRPEDFLKFGDTEIAIPQRAIDEGKPQLERIINRLLEEKGLDPDEVKRDSPEWLETEKVAIACITGGQSYALPETVETDGSTPPQGFQYKKADPNIWGRPPWEIEDERKAKED